MKSQSIKINNKKIKVKKGNQLTATRYNPKYNEGLKKEQVMSRMINGLSNNVTNYNNKSILSIISKNTFTFFNFLCVLVFAAYIYIKIQDNSFAMSNFMFCIPFAVNYFISIFQEIRAKISVEKLSIIQSPQTTVIREGKEEEISSNQVVLDDVFKLHIGDQIPVDGIVLNGVVEVNESLLTGESIAVKKKENSPVLAGSFVTSGTCYCRADKVADECYVQKLTAKVRKYKKPHSELMNTLSWLIKIIGILIVPMAIGIGLVNYKFHNETDGLLTTFVVKNTGSVILGLIPSGLVMLTTIALSLGVIRLHKKNTLVQDMYSLEMLARTDVLCLDKTGTITDGRMKVVKDFFIKDSYDYNLNDIIGNMETVLKDTNQTANALRAHYIQTKEYESAKILPFSSSRKFSAVSFIGIGTFSIGAPEFMLQTIPDNLKEEIEKYSFLGNRVLVLTHSPLMLTSENLPINIKPIAVIVLTDNIRDDAIDTIKWFKNNDVKVKVISGDNPITVSEIAKRVGVDNAQNWISLDGLSDKEVAAVADKYTVFGRVTPDQKAILIKSMRRSGHTVAMTGDGVNDILAMRQSDVAVTVASGSDATKNVAHIVLTDNNFNSMPKVVAEGRRVINNIQQSASLYLMKTIFIALLALISIITMKTFPFESGHLTMMEMIVIGFGSLVLSLQPNNKRVEGDFLITMLGNAIPGSLILLANVYIVVFLNYFGLFDGTELLTTMQVVLFTLGSVVFLYYLCKPFNVLRGVLITIVSVVMVLWLVFLLDTSSFTGTPLFNLKNIFPLTTDNWKYFALIVAIIELDFPLLSLFLGLNVKLRTLFGEKKYIKSIDHK